MICDNCGAETDKKEMYCPNCGMEFPTHKSSKNNHYKNSRAVTPDKTYSKDNYRQQRNKQDFERNSLKRKDMDSSDFTYDIPHPKADYRNYNEEEDYKRKPLKRKYYGDSPAPTRQDSHYQDELDYESYYEAEDSPKTKKSRISLGTICLFMVMILLLGFVIGLIMFSNTQSIPQVPGFNS